MADVIIDIILVLFVLIGAFVGLKRGFISMLGNQVKRLLAIVFAFALCRSFADGFVKSFVFKFLQKTPEKVLNSLSIILSFIIIYIISRIVMSLLLGILNKIFDKGFFGIINKFIGFIFAGFLSMIVASVLVSLFGYLLNAHIITENAFFSEFSGGVIYKLLESLSPIELIKSFFANQQSP